jgi:hypothetical protein
MDFVKVMGIAKRFREWNKTSGNDLPMWFTVVFVRLIEAQDITLWQTAQRELLTWAAEHPEQTKAVDPCEACGVDPICDEHCKEKRVFEAEKKNGVHQMPQGAITYQKPDEWMKATKMPAQTETKEENTVESKRTRVHELLGVEPCEWFKIEGVKEFEYMLLQDGTVKERTNGDNRFNYWKYAAYSTLPDLINGTLNIIRRPTLTDEQRDVLAALDRLGFTHVAKNANDSMVATVGEPYNLASENYQWHAMDEDECGCEVITAVSKIQCLRPLLPDWTQPLDIAAMLKEAGV